MPAAPGGVGGLPSEDRAELAAAGVAQLAQDTADPGIGKESCRGSGLGGWSCAWPASPPVRLSAGLCLALTRDAAPLAPPPPKAELAGLVAPRSWSKHAEPQLSESQLCWSTSLVLAGGWGVAAAAAAVSSTAAAMPPACPCSRLMLRLIPR